jgi:hypothetical protein
MIEYRENARGYGDHERGRGAGDRTHDDQALAKELRAPPPTVPAETRLLNPPHLRCVPRTVAEMTLGLATRLLLGETLGSEPGLPSPSR